MSVEEDKQKSDQNFKKRRKRTIIMPAQLEKLECAFKRDPWPNRARKEKLAQELGMAEHIVSIWFQNKRARVKRGEDISKKQDNFLTKCNNPDKIVVSAKLFKKANFSPNQVMNFTDPNSQNKLQGLSHDQHVPIQPNTVVFYNSETEQHLKLRPADPTKATDDNCKDNSLHLIRSTSFDATPSKSTCISKDQVPVGDVTPQNVVSSYVSNLGPKSKGITIHLKRQRPKRMSQCPMGQGQGLAWYTTVHKGGNDCLGQKEISDRQKMIESHLQQGKTAANYFNSSRRPVLSNPPTLFHAIINMMAIAEGNIIKPDNPEFESAVTDALYGILINGTTQLLYEEDIGLNMVELTDL